LAALRGYAPMAAARRAAKQSEAGTVAELGYCTNKVMMRKALF